MGRWRAVIVQWNEVESTFAHHYHLTFEDIQKMTWRRFRVLFGGVFSWKDPEEDLPGQGKIASQVDWGSAKHIPAKQLSDIGIDTHRLPVGKS